MMSHLDIADKTLKSCRDDLRNCLWDLRSRALEETDMNSAILRTLSPHVSKARLAVRFNVRRNLLSENAAHAVLRIVRELTLNAIRHGNASVVKIAGSTENGRLLFSVSDDGCGFDADAAPGIPQGHFGISGIRERVEQLGGVFTLSSRPGHGTVGRVELPIPHQGEK
jgi:signal transduction histidine kinase